MKKIDLKEVLKSIKVLLSGEEIVETIETTETNDTVVELEQLPLMDDVTVIESDDFSVGSPVFIVTEEENVPLPIGNYELKDGRILVVEEGIIASIGEVQEEETTEEETTEEETEEEEEELSEETVTREEFDSKLAELQAIIDDLKSQLNLSQTTITDKDTVIDELNVQLSELPAVKKLSHSPELSAFITKVNPKNENTNKGVSTLNKILDHIEQNKI